MIISETRAQRGAAGVTRAWSLLMRAILIAPIIFLAILFVRADVGIGPDRPVSVNNNATFIKEGPLVSTGANRDSIKFYPSMFAGNLMKYPSQPSPQPCSEDKPDVCP